jgi:predicted secreted hydrolase
MRVVAATLLTLALGACGGPPTPAGDPGAEQTLAERLGAGDTAGYARASAPRAFDFPADHGPHPAFRNEWWYVTGNLEAADGRRFGYQVTFFRIALRPAAAERPSAWATRDVWMAHVALSDLEQRRHLHAERFARGAADLAGASAAPFRVWLEDWQVIGRPGFPWRVQVDAGAFRLDLELNPQRPPVLQGEQGLSRKSAEPGNASYYYSMTRLATRGRIRLADQELEVAGLSWLDREWSTSALSATQAGWDWFALQLDDGRDLMFYRLRGRDGSTDPLSAGSLVQRDGRVQPLRSDQLRLRPLRWWQDRHGSRYPVSWELTLPGEARPLRVDAAFDAQLMDVSVRYWEGAVTVRNDDDPAIVGRGYLELAGYATGSGAATD